MHTKKRPNGSQVVKQCNKTRYNCATGCWSVLTRFFPLEWLSSCGQIPAGLGFGRRVGKSYDRTHARRSEMQQKAINRAHSTGIVQHNERKLIWDLKTIRSSTVVTGLGTGEGNSLQHYREISLSSSASAKPPVGANVWRLWVAINYAFVCLFFWPILLL